MGIEQTSVGQGYGLLTYDRLFGQMQGGTLIQGIPGKRIVIKTISISCSFTSGFVRLYGEGDSGYVYQFYPTTATSTLHMNDLNIVLKEGQSLLMRTGQSEYGYVNITYSVV